MAVVSPCCDMGYGAKLTTMTEFSNFVRVVSRSSIHLSLGNATEVMIPYERPDAGVSDERARASQPVFGADH